MKGPTTVAAHSSHATSVLFSPYSRILVSAGMDRTIRLWDVACWNSVGVLEGHEHSVNTLSFSADGGILASGSSDTTVRLRSFPVGELPEALSGHRKMVACVAISPEATPLASASYDSTVRLWDLPSGEELATLSDYDKNVTAVAFSPDGQTLASSGLGSQILLWSIPKTQLMSKLEGHEVAVGSLSVSADGRLLASAGYEQTVKLWSTADWAVARSLELPSAPGFVALAPDSRTLAVGVAHKVLLWSVEDGALLEQLPVGVKGVYQLAFSPDGRWLALVAADGKIRIWETVQRPTGESIARSASVWRVSKTRCDSTGREPARSIQCCRSAF